MALDIPPSPTVEATSLASVLELASNPPPRPPPFQPGTAPLVLYIARVPGSRDVFLTPIKPREKVVTASDVQSSLYYIHCNYAENDEVSHRSSQAVTSKFSSVNTEAAYLSNISNSKSLRRKAVPPPLPRRPAPPVSPPHPVDDGDMYLPPQPQLKPPYPIDENEIEHEKPALPPRSGSVKQKVERKPVVPRRSPERPPRVHLNLPLDLPILPPRPLPPTPPQEESESPLSSSLHEDNMRLLRRESHTDETNNPYLRNYPLQPPLPAQEPLSSQLEPGTLTLIRRNPGSNDQWNVATIHDSPTISETSSSSILLPTAKRRTKKAGGAPIHLEITTPGYGQFVISATETDTSKLSLDTTASRSSSEENYKQQQQQQHQRQQSAEAIFSRQLYMPGSNHAHQTSDPHPQTHHRFGSTSSESTIPARKPLRTQQQQRHSVDLTTTPNSSVRPETRSKNYTFASPWEGGHCDFVTGARGTTLKCRHSYLDERRTFPVLEEVSELRFNLPTTTTSTSKPGNAGSPTRNSYFSTRPHLLSHHGADGADANADTVPPAVMMDASGRMDLSLGRERAGGGFGGGKAKLGKLIVYPGAGFAMLDLLVAANVGLWWRAWERV